MQRQIDSARCSLTQAAVLVRPSYEFWCSTSLDLWPDSSNTFLEATLEIKVQIRETLTFLNSNISVQMMVYYC